MNNLEINAILKKQLRLSGHSSHMVKTVSENNLSAKNLSEMDNSANSLTSDNKHLKSKSQSLNIPDISGIITSLYKSMTEQSNDDFFYDNLPIHLTSEWITVKYSMEQSATIKKKNLAVLELLTTELNFLRQMQYLLDVSASIFSEIQPKYFAYIKTDDIFLNLGEIYEVNYKFWTKYLYPSFINAKENDTFISCSNWKEGFNQISYIFNPYQKYCSMMTQCQKYIQSLEKDKYFAQFLQWFSHTEQSNRETLADFIAKPFQRLTKYKLLLTTIYGYSENEEERKDLTEMIDSINQFLKQVECELSITQISMRLDPIDFVEPPSEDLIELCLPFRHINLAAPVKTADGEIIRKMIKESSFKMKEAQLKIIEVTLILFTDLILICQKIKNFQVDKIKIIRPIISLDKLNVVSSLPGSLILRVLDDFGCLVSMYQLINEQTIINEWTEAIQNAKFLVKNHSFSKHNTDFKSINTLRINFMNASQLPGRFQTLNYNPLNGPPKSLQLHRTSNNASDNFFRSHFYNSPVIRRQMTTPNSNFKTRPKSLSDDNPSKPFTSSITINRSISQCKNATISLLKDENEHKLNLRKICASSIDFPIQDDSLSFKLSHKQNKLIKYHEKNNNILDKFSRTINKFGKMKPYGSMVNLSFNF